jgi:branched-subunit amino acid transport protein AzlD
MAMLVVYCLKGISFAKAPFGLPELISVILVAVLHIWKRNTLLSIICGTICYMVCIQFVF